MLDSSGAFYEDGFIHTVDLCPTRRLRDLVTTETSEPQLLFGFPHYPSLSYESVEELSEFNSSYMSGWGGGWRMTDEEFKEVAKQILRDNPNDLS